MPAAHPRGGVPYPNVGLHGLFEERVAADPDAVAVVGDGERLTYGELDARANQIAQILLGAGVHTDEPVGIALERSTSLVAALLGVLKAGAAYLPLDLGTPPARLAQILTDAGSRVCLTWGGSAVELPAPVRRLDLDAGWRQVGTASTARPTPVISGLNLVSVYYTSGSTGSPKGVMSTHAGWVNRMAWMQRQHDLRPGEAVLHKTTLTFDDAALEIFWPLSVGGLVAVLAPGAHQDPHAILTAMSEHDSVYLQVVPSMLTMMLDVVEQDPAATPRALRNTTSSGEALPPGSVARFLRLMPGDLHNTWGATEVSIDSTHHMCVAADAETEGAVCVGKAFDNNEVRVLDAHLHPVPTGMVGDLYLGGVGLARGYLGDPVATALAFVPHPTIPGARIYATGDRGLVRPDGSVMFVGRQDHQVKIRGMRVELGEIESILRRHQGVRDAAATLDTPEEGPQRLVAFVTPRELNVFPDPRELRDHVARALPDYMVPTLVLPQSDLPLNANGKVDRRRLVVPTGALARPVADFLRCQGVLEEALGDIWCELLALPQVGADDNFFDLGGHSLLATRLASRVRARFGVSLSVRSVFEEPTVRQLAVRVEEMLVAAIDALTVEQVQLRLDAE